MIKFTNNHKKILIINKIKSYKHNNIIKILDSTINKTLKWVIYIFNQLNPKIINILNNDFIFNFCHFIIKNIFNFYFFLKNIKILKIKISILIYHKKYWILNKMLDFHRI